MRKGGRWGAAALLALAGLLAGLYGGAAGIAAALPREELYAAEAKAPAETDSPAETEALTESEAWSETETAENFYAEMIPDSVFEQMAGKSYPEDCPVPREDLRCLHLLHKNLQGETKEGEMICHKTIAGDLVDIFQELYLKDYPIEKIRPVDDYGGDDERSMEDDNTSCFNYRLIPYSQRISKHGLGVAVDINTFYNPYTRVADGDRIVQPSGSEAYLDRDASFPYKIEEGDLCWQLFTDHGFEWGGSWENVKDYQHFELPDSVTDQLLKQYNNADVSE